ncbi:hypothetical protein FWK35_00034110 [Aphis craccivora]|uniref:Uncharacterized protein n=1 Tax=Aphis craccivora TaxID=307492 RepID=A0A6G0YQD7_APHCR|nr:hypothetical protein FWK35_00034110 [Aphis craccivora]
MWVKRKRQSTLVVDQSETVSRFSYRWIRYETIIITVLLPRPSKPSSHYSSSCIRHSEFEQTATCQ